MDFKLLKENLKKDFTGLKKIKLALLADSAEQFLAIALRGYGYSLSYDIEVYAAPFAQIENELFDTESGFYEFKPDFALIWYSPRKLLKQFCALSDSEKSQYAKQKLLLIRKLCQNINQYHPACKIIFTNFPDLGQQIFGNYASKVSISFEYQLRKLNLELMELSQETANFYIHDLCALQARYGEKQLFDARMYVVADMVYGLEAMPLLAKNILDIIAAQLGQFKKCLILDLDNTLWGGIIGDDGIEKIEIGDLGIGKTFTDLQAWAKQLKERGVILAVCSQNAVEIAKIPFLQHPDMLLKLEDIAVFVANWGSKADNIKYIQEILNIGFNSMVFLDDDPYQRNLVKTYLPEVCVPELPKDPADYLPYLTALNLFETASYSEEDKQRNRYYQEESSRTLLKESFTNELDYLQHLEMVAEILPFNEFTLPRIEQLLQRSNQFNLRTIRYSLEELREIAQREEMLTFAFSMKDKFGSYGIVSVAILKPRRKNVLFIDTWLMSCRVLKRGLEDVVLDCMQSVARNKNYDTLMGEYVPTSKNSLVKDHYRKMGFTQHEEGWLLSLKNYQPKAHAIKITGRENYAALEFAACN